LSATLDSTSAALAVRNTVAGAAKYSRFAIGNDTSATIFDAYAFSSTYTPSAWEKAGGAAIFVPSTGGLSLVSQSGEVRIFSGSLATPTAVASSTGLAVTGALSATGNVVAFSDSANGNSAFESTFSGTTRNGLDLADSTDTSGVFFGVFRKASGGEIGSITRVTTTDAVVYNTTSDGRLKENLRDFTDSGRLIDSLKPRVFDWKNSDENGKNVVGFVAQEQHAADPIFAHIGAVSVGDQDPETITKQWQRSDSALIPILVAELKSVRARLAALESK
jgi:phosphosulfolactate phosphohydrolase-like enzyme